MPHCELNLCGNVLEANWTPANLNKIIILANSFMFYKTHEKEFSYHFQAKKMKPILDSDHMLHEIPLPRVNRAVDGLTIALAFDHLSWHFFDWDGSLHGFNSEETSGGGSAEGEETNGSRSAGRDFASDSDDLRT
jgi:hypothetical protein